MWVARILTAAVLAVSANAASGASSTDRVAFTGSIAAHPTRSTNRMVPQISRTPITDEEYVTPIDVRMDLAFRNLDELRSRAARGDIVSAEEMVERYYPTSAAGDTLAGWLRSQGLTIVPADRLHLAVFARGSRRVVAQCLGTEFAHVRGVDGRDYVSAATAPSLPAKVAGSVIAIDGLQPDLWARPAVNIVGAANATATITPAMVREYYHASALDGRGQTIAIMGDGVDPADLAKFWEVNGITQSLANYSVVNIAWTPLPFFGGIGPMEATGDVEWASAMAPAAKIRLYCTVDPAQFAIAILNDLASVPGLSQASMSSDLEEVLRPADSMRAESQYYAALAAQGVTMFVSSGDGGSNSRANRYDPSYPLSVECPASDPCVTAVGGTMLFLDTTRTHVIGESAWGTPLVNGILQPGAGASGGGSSQVWARPVWQVGPGTSSGAMRMVPDVAAVWGGVNVFCSIQFEGQASTFAGTSLSSPVWAGLCALLNQQRAANGLSAIGLLGPKIYPLIGTDAFNDITFGTNGAYAAGIGYDMCTGIGTPNIEKLAAILTDATQYPQATIPAITGNPATQAVAPGANVSMSVSATSADAISYQWMVLAPGDQNWATISDSPGWKNLTDDATYSGSHGATLSITSATTAISGSLYQCQVTNSYGIALTTPARVVVDPNQRIVAPTIVDARWATTYVGGKATLSVTAVGSEPLTYQWKDLTGAVIPGATSGTLPFDSAKPSDAGGYWVAVSNAAGTAQYGCALQVLTNPTLTLPPYANATVGQPFSLRLTAQANDQSIVPASSDYTGLYAGAGLPPGLTLNGGMGVISGTPTQVGTYDVAISATNAVGSDTVHVNFTVTDAGPPQILFSPESQNIGKAGMPSTALRFHVVASGGGLTYAWKLNGGDIPSGGLYEGLGTDTLQITQLQPNQAGTYTVTVSNGYGSATAAPATLTIGNSPGIVIPPPHEQDVVAGAPVWLNVAAIGSGKSHRDGLTYQWRLNGTPIPGATDCALHLARVGSDQAGTYDVVVTNLFGTVTSSGSRVGVSSDGKPVNMSTRCWVGSGADAEFGGFSISGNSPKQVLIRAGGPSLRFLGLNGVLADPVLELHDAIHGNAIIAQNDNWSDAPSMPADIERVAAATGAFAWPRGSKDAALLVTLEPGLYSAVVRGRDDGTGIAMFEVYDADGGNSASILTNVSTRAHARTGDQSMIGGFTIAGTQPKTVLIRAIGPSLGILGVPSLLPNPLMEVHSVGANNAIIARNQRWSDDTAAAMAVEIAGKATGAFPLARGSADAAIVATLDPGAYTVVVSDPNGADGNALVEVYEIP